MKVLIDPVYTSRVHTCSTSYLAWEVIEQGVREHDDMFFYLMYPEKADQDKEQKKFLMRHQDRVKLLPYPCIQTDRVKEMLKFSDELHRILAPGTPVWDYDAVLTSRILQIPFMRMVQGRALSYHKGTYRVIVGMDEMPMFRFRDKVLWANTGHTDLANLNAYLMSDGIVVNNLWTRNNAVRLAKTYLTPSKVVEFSDQITEALPIRVQKIEDSEKPMNGQLNVAFCGRPTGTRNFSEVAELFRKQFAYPLGKNGTRVHLMVSTHSNVGSLSAGEIDFIEWQENNREEFYAMLKKDVHVVVNLSSTEDFSLSTYEPLSFGIPVIVADREWSDFLGKEYPFRSGNLTEAYALIKDFAIDYGGCYEKFMNWSNGYWSDFVNKWEDRTTGNAVFDILLSGHEKALEAITNSQMGMKYRKLAEMANATGMKKMDIAEYGIKEGMIMEKKDWASTSLGRAPNLHLLKMTFKLAGWKDTLETGVMERK